MDWAAECTWAEWIPVIVLHEVFVGGICGHLLQLSFLRERDGSRFNWPWLKSVVTHLLIVHSPYFTNTSGIAREPLVPLPNSDQRSGVSHFNSMLLDPSSVCQRGCWEMTLHPAGISQKMFFFLCVCVHKCQSFSLWLITFWGIIFCLCEQFGPVGQSRVHTFFYINMKCSDEFNKIRF